MARVILRCDQFVRRVIVYHPKAKLTIIIREIIDRRLKKTKDASCDEWDPSDGKQEKCSMCLFRPSLSLPPDSRNDKHDKQRIDR